MVVDFVAEEYLRVRGEGQFWVEVDNIFEGEVKFSFGFGFAVDKNRHSRHSGSASIWTRLTEMKQKIELGRGVSVGREEEEKVWRKRLGFEEKNHLFSHSVNLDDERGRLIVLLRCSE